MGISGDADEPDGVVFTDGRGRRLASGRPTPPAGSYVDAARQLGIPTGSWAHPSGEHLDSWSVSFEAAAHRATS